MLSRRKRNPDAVNLIWSEDTIESATPAVQDLLAQRIDELIELFKHQRKRTGGDRATHTAET